MISNVWRLDDFNTLWEVSSPVTDDSASNFFELETISGWLGLGGSGAAVGNRQIIQSQDVLLPAGGGVRVTDPLASVYTDPPPFAIPQAAATQAPQVMITDIARIAGGVAEITFSVPVTVVTGGFAGEADLDINGHTALTFNSQPLANKVRVNTGGGTIVGQPWQIFGQLAWIPSLVIGFNNGLIT